MKLFVLALLALSCVQLVIAKLPPFQTLELTGPAMEKINKGPKNPFQYLHVALPPSLFADTPALYGELLEVRNHPELICFFPEISQGNPGNPEIYQYIYFSRAKPQSNKKPVPIGEKGYLSKVPGRDLLVFQLMTDLTYNSPNQEPGSKTGYSGSGYKENEQEFQYNPRALHLKLEPPPLFGLEVYGEGRDGFLTAYPSGIYDFKPLPHEKGLKNKIPKPVWEYGPYLPRFYLKSEVPEKFKDVGSTWRGRLYQFHPEIFTFEGHSDVHASDDTHMLGFPKRNRPGKIRRTYPDGNEAMMRGLPNTYRNPALRFL